MRRSRSLLTQHKVDQLMHLKGSTEFWNPRAAPLMRKGKKHSHCREVSLLSNEVKLRGREGSVRSVLLSCSCTAVPNMSCMQVETAISLLQPLQTHTAPTHNWMHTYTQPDDAHTHTTRYTHRHTHTCMWFRLGLSHQGTYSFCFALDTSEVTGKWREQRLS